MRRWWLSLILGLGTCLSPLAAEAAGVFTITPSFQDVTVAPGSPSTVRVQVKNDTMAAVTFNLTTLDFGSLDATGGVILIDPAKNQSGHGVAKFLAQPPSSITVAAGQTGQVQLPIINLDQLTPGGHYGAITLQPIAVAGPKPTQPNADINAVLTSLIFLHKLGGERYQFNLSGFGLSRIWLHWPDNIQLKFRNNGNIHLTPRGKVELISPGGRVVGKGIINQSSGLLMPGSVRAYPVTISHLQRVVLPGLYQIRISYHRDGSDQLRVVTQHIVYLPVVSLIIGVGLLLAVVGLIIWLIRRRH